MAVETQDQLAAAYAQQQQPPSSVESQEDLAAAYQKQQQSAQGQGNSQTQSTPIPLGQAPSLQPPSIASTKTQPGASVPAPTAGAPTTPEGTSLGQKVIGTFENKVLGVAHDLTAAEKVAQHLATEAPTAPAIAYWQYKLHFGTPEEQATAKQKIDAMPGQAAMIMAGAEEAAPEMEAAEAAQAGLPEEVEGPPPAEAAPKPQGPGSMKDLVVKPSDDVQKGFSDIFKDAAGITDDSIQPTAEDPYSARQVADSKIAKYKDAATTLDKLSDNEFSNAQQDVEDAADDFTSQGKRDFRAAQQKMADIIEQHKPALESMGINADEMSTDYRKGMVYKKIAAALDPTTEETGAANDELTTQTKQGPVLRETVRRLAQNNKDLFEKGGLKQDHVTQLIQQARRMNRTLPLGKLAKGTARVVAHGAGLGTGYEIAKGLL